MTKKLTRNKKLNRETWIHGLVVRDDRYVWGWAFTVNSQIRTSWTKRHDEASDRQTRWDLSNHWQTDEWSHVESCLPPWSIVQFLFCFEGEACMQVVWKETQHNFLWRASWKVHNSPSTVVDSLREEARRRIKEQQWHFYQDTRADRG